MLESGFGRENITCVKLPTFTTTYRKRSFLFISTAIRHTVRSANLRK